MSSVPQPVVRQFIPCSSVGCDTTVFPNRYIIEDPFSVIVPPERGYPFRVAEFWLFCQLADATGSHELVIEQSWDLDAEVLILHRFRVEFGPDRLGVRNFAVKLKKVAFIRPGFYEFRLSEGATKLACATVRLEEAHDRTT